MDLVQGTAQSSLNRHWTGADQTLHLRW